MKFNTLGFALVACLCGAAFADPYTLENGVLTFDVDEADYPESAPYEYTESLSALSAIVKSGTGAVSLGTTATANTFTGTITVEDGFLMGWKPRFGKPSTVTVADGGAVVFTETSTYASTIVDNFANTHFYIVGSGPDGNGALQRPYARAKTDNYFLSYVTMTGDATINVGSRWGISAGTLDMNNHTLTLSSAKEDTAYASRQYSRLFDIARGGTTYVKNPGEIIVTDNCRLNVESNNSKIADAEGSNGTVSNMTVHVTDGNYLRLFEVRNGNFPCPVVFEGTSYLMLNNCNLTDEKSLIQSHADGPVEIAGSKLSLSLYNSGVAASNACLWLNGPVSGPGMLENPTRARVYLTGANTNVFGSFRQTAYGSITLQDDVTVHITNAAQNATYAMVAYGTSTELPPTLVLKDNARLLCREGCGKTSELLIGADNSYGIMRIQDNAVVSNNVSVGLYGRGACYMTGGELHVLTGCISTSLMLAQQTGSYGYIGLDDGFFHANYWFYFGRMGPGFLVQRGGESLFGTGSHPLRLAHSGTASYGHLAFLGGTSRWNNRLAMNFSSYSPVSTYSTAVLTVAGSNTVMDMTGSFIWSVVATNAAKSVTALVNLNDGGTVKANYFARKQYPGTDSPSWASISNLVADATHTYLNFNGGVLVTTRAGEFFGSTSTENIEQYRFTRATVFEKGAVIDTNGKDVTWRMPLERPYGYGIASVTLPAAAMATNALIGPTRCFITSSAGGVAADALMDFDNTNRVARGMIVASRGFGYESAPVATVHQANCSDTWDCTVETVDFDAADFAHGGLTKRGEGTLTVTSTNTYGGATRLEGGTLAFTHVNGYPGGNLEIAASAVQGTLSAPLLTAHTLAFASGKGVVVTEADELDDTTFGKAKTVATFTKPLESEPSLTLLSSDGTELPTGAWKLFLQSGGTELKFGLSRGTMLILR